MIYMAFMGLTVMMLHAIILAGDCVFGGLI